MNKEMNTDKLLQRKKLLSNYLSLTLFVLLLCSFTITRFWRILTIPSGFHIDEAGMAYDAWCLSQYGVDRYLKSFPVYLINFGGGQNALYTYLTAALFRLFGFHEILIRIPGIFFSFLNLIFGMLLVKKIFPNRPYLVLGTGFLITICPFFILTARVGIESHLMLGASTVFLYLFVNAIDTGKFKYYILAGIAGGITLYTYALSYLMLPLFLLFSLIYVIRIRKFSLPEWLAMAIPMFLLAFPLIMTQLINLFDWEEMRLGIFTLTKLPHYRSEDLHLFSFDRFCLAVNTILVGDDLNYNSISGIPNMYWISIPLIIIGLVHTIHRTIIAFRNRLTDTRVFILWWFLSVFLVLCHIDCSTSRVNSIFLTLVILIIDAVSIITPLKKWARIAVKTIIVGVYSLLFLLFSGYYYLGQYTIDNYPLDFFDICVSEALDFIEENPIYGPKEVQMAELPIYFALSSLYSPYDLLLSDQQKLIFLDYFHCSSLGEIEDGYYYIVRDIYAEYADELRASGFAEINYGNYSLFYQE